jgi:acyl-CoA thioester hydrolase
MFYKLSIKKCKKPTALHHNTHLGAEIMAPHLSGKMIARAPAGINRSPLSYHITGLRVPLFEVDLGQAVYHGNYFHLLELAREDFLRKIGFPYREFMKRQLHLTIVESSCVYRKPLHYDEEIEIHSRITWNRRRSLAMEQLIFRGDASGTKELTTQAVLNMVCVRFSGRPAILPEDFCRAISEYAQEGH